MHIHTLTPYAHSYTCIHVNTRAYMHTCLPAYGCLPSQPRRQTDKHVLSFCRSFFRSFCRSFFLSLFRPFVLSFIQSFMQAHMHTHMPLLDMSNLHHRASQHSPKAPWVSLGRGSCYTVQSAHLSEGVLGSVCLRHDTR